MSQSGDYNSSVNPILQPILGVIGDNAVVVPPDPATGDINIVGGPGIVTNGNAANYTLTISSTSFGPFWNDTTTSLTMAADNGYMCTAGGGLLLGLPATSAFGEQIAIILDGATSFTITQAAGQQIRLGDTTTTLGAAGSIGSLFQGDSITLICKVANTLWVADAVTGNLTIT